MSAILIPCVFFPITTWALYNEHFLSDEKDLYRIARWRGNVQHTKFLLTNVFFWIFYVCTKKKYVFVLNDLNREIKAIKFNNFIVGSTNSKKKYLKTKLSNSFLRDL